jgi:cysteinyl-tRNA synthetase
METAAIEYEKIEKAVQQMAVTLQLAGIKLKGDEQIDITPFLSFLADDLNTPNAITELFAIIKKANATLRQKPLDYRTISRTFDEIQDMLWILGLKVEYPLLNEDDKKIYADYLKYKAEKNFTESDRLRQILMAKHIL